MFRIRSIIFVGALLSTCFGAPVVGMDILFGDSSEPVSVKPVTPLAFWGSLAAYSSMRLGLHAAMGWAQNRAQHHLRDEERQDLDRLNNIFNQNIGQNLDDIALRYLNELRGSRQYRVASLFLTRAAAQGNVAMTGACNRRLQLATEDVQKINVWCNKIDAWLLDHPRESYVTRELAYRNTYLFLPQGPNRRFEHQLTQGLLRRLGIIVREHESEIRGIESNYEQRRSRELNVLQAVDGLLTQFVLPRLIVPVLTKGIESRCALMNLDGSLGHAFVGSRVRHNWMWTALGLGVFYLGNRSGGYWYDFFSPEMQQQPRKTRILKGIEATARELGFGLMTLAGGRILTSRAYPMRGSWKMPIAFATNMATGGAMSMSPGHALTQPLELPTDLIK